MLVMGKLNNNIIKAVLLLTVFLLLSTNSSATDDETEAVKTNSPFNIIDAAKRLYSLPTASDSGDGSWRSFQSPNLDFKGGGGGDNKVEGEEAAAVRVKDAVVKSLDESRETMEDSAKSAARFVVDKTVNKLKTTLSSQHDHQTEL